MRAWRGGWRFRLEVTVNCKNAIVVSEPLLVRTTLTAKEMERLDRVRRRCDWLKRRIANHRGDPGFDKAELSALEWAIRFIEDVTAW